MPARRADRSRRVTGGQQSLSVDVVSNAVSVASARQLTITGVTQTGIDDHRQRHRLLAVSVINLFNQQGAGVGNLGGYGAGSPNIPLTLVSRTSFTFAVPAGAIRGPPTCR